MLRQIIEKLDRNDDPRLLVGAETADDAAVYLIAPGLALVHTVDFITPILDDPFNFGQVAAANSLSDVYAMGGRPHTALNVACFPDAKIDAGVLADILLGGQRKCAEAGCLVVGGHTVSDPELKYGLAVTGSVNPDAIVRNSTARPGDRLVLTKGLGTGILATALKKGKLPVEETRALVDSMARLNDRAGAAMVEHGASAATDITGFGLFGHALEMAEGAGVRLGFSAARLPLLPGAIEMARKGYLTGADRRNREMLGARFSGDAAIDPALIALGFDAQTSGGLLIALPPAAVASFLHRIPEAVEVGRVEAGPEPAVSIEG